MQPITASQLQDAVPDAKPDVAAMYVDALNAAMVRFGINSGVRVAAFVAQIAHESGSFRAVEENLNYSWQGLRKTWPSRFTSDAFAQPYDRQPQKIANYVYASRNGNGNTASGDGWNFRGRGLIQVTGRSNYTAYGKGISDGTVVQNPGGLITPVGATLSAAWFWNSKGLNPLADKDDEDTFRQISRIINGGNNGMQDRLDRWDLARQVFC
ncbi:glycoside hydrolase family 19 protein [Ramlibacter sp.]|uniref:glycoside hydrolase family 19 protein n=1 Tax=Ramlibacter sp. TaxID=1917967 RepID=UPI0017C2A83B|nr:glycoside hydrolase family 19 protein [Ramlibacter sp.]MBA2676319.1 glycoside hydrolase family 19 protein [Ramlibacter sp.]